MNSFLLIIASFLTFLSFGQKEGEYDKMVDSLQRSGKSQELILFFQNELKVKPKNEMILRQLGYLLIAENNLELAENYYTQALTINPKCAMCYLNIGRIYGKKGEHSKALEYFNKAIDLDPNDARLYSNRGQLKEFLGDKFGALFDYNYAIKLDEHNSDYYIQRGLLHLKRDYVSLAQSDLDKAVELSSESYSPYFQRARFYYGRRMMEEALKDVNVAVQLDSNQSVLYTLRGAINAALDKHNAAIDDYTTAIRLNPKDELPYYNRSLSKYSLEDMDGSCEDLNTSYSILLEYNPENGLRKEIEASIENFCDSSKAAYYYQRGIALFNLQQFEKSLKIYTSGLAKFPESSLLLSFRGNAYFSMKEYQKALTDYNASIANQETIISDYETNVSSNLELIQSSEEYKNGFLATMRSNMAKAKFALGNYKEALIDINKGIEIAPEMKGFGKENFYHVRGSIYLAVGEFQNALTDFEMCIQLNPSFAFGYVNRAIAKIALDSKVSLISTSVEGGNNNQEFSPHWEFEWKSSKRKSASLFSSEISDCDKAIELDASLALTYYVRGQLRKVVNQSDSCDDILKAKALAYPVEIELWKECKK